MADDALILPAGYGFRPFTPEEIRLTNGFLLDAFFIWEKPRRRGRAKYVIGADVSDGLGLDRSVAEVLRVGTIEEPTEQVAEFASDAVDPMHFAFILQAIGQYYSDADGVEAYMAIECNNHGLSTQNTLQLHLGYGNFYIWEYYDAADPGRRMSTKIGWYTTPSTRPMLLDKLKSGLTTTDPISGNRDLVTHSPLFHDELKDFQTEGALWEAEAARGAHDDTIMAMAIANYAVWKLQGGEAIPLEELRRLKSEQRARQEDHALAGGQSRDWRNSAVTADELDDYFGLTDADNVDEVLYRL